MLYIIINAVFGIFALFLAKNNIQAVAACTGGWLNLCSYGFEPKQRKKDKILFFFWAIVACICLGYTLDHTFPQFLIFPTGYAISSVVPAIFYYAFYLGARPKKPKDLKPIPKKK